MNQRSRRQEFVDAAMRLLDREGINGFTMRSLAEELDPPLSPMAAYKHFENQRELQLELWRACIVSLGASLSDAAATVPRDGDGAKRMVEVARAFMDFALAFPKRFELLFNHPFITEVWQQSDIDAIREAVWSLSRSVIEDGQSSGSVRKDIGANELLAIVYAQVHGASALLASGRLQKQTGLDASTLRDMVLQVVNEYLADGR